MKNKMYVIVKCIYTKIKDLLLYQTDIKTKLILLYVPLIILPLFCSGFLIDNITSKSISNRTRESSFRSLETISANLNFVQSEVNSISKLIISNSDVQEILKKYLTIGEVNYGDKDRLNSKLAEIASMDPLISSVYVFSNTGDKYIIENSPMDSRSAFSSVYLDIMKSDLYKKILDLDGLYYWKSSFQNIFGDYNNGMEIISQMRIIKDTYTLSNIGFLVININVNNLSKIYVSNGNEYHSFSFVIDENGRPLEKDDFVSEFYDQNFYDQFLNLSRDGFKYEIQNKTYMISYITLPESKWKIISISPLDEILKESRDLKKYIFIISFIAVLIGIIGTILISYGITKPIYRLANYMRGVGKGNLNIAINSRSKDEIGILEDGLNYMILKIKDLIEKIQDEQRIARKAELAVLQAQIKPHFLYNTLESICSLSKLGDCDEIYKLTKALSNLFRTSLSNGQEFITVGEEINCTVNYIIIQSIRYKDKFDFYLHMDEGCKNFKTPKLIIQPIVENAIYHGIRKKKGKCTLMINVYRQELFVYIEVIDDGMGFETDHLSGSTNGNVPPQGKGGFGLKNIKERLDIYFQKQAEISFESEIGSGTKVTVKIPEVLDKVSE